MDRFTNEDRIKFQIEREERADRVRNASMPRFTNPIEPFQNTNVTPRTDNSVLLHGEDVGNRDALKGTLSTKKVTPIPKSNRIR